MIPQAVTQFKHKFVTLFPEEILPKIYTVNSGKMPKRKSGLFSCFGRSSDDQPEIRYEPDGGVNLQAMEYDVPMPEMSELDAKFAELVVSGNMTIILFEMALKHENHDIEYRNRNKNT